MTFFKQIILAIFFLIVLIFIFVGYLNFSSINNYYISNNLSINSKNTANVLKLVIDPLAEKNDIVRINSVIDTIFDSGYYKMIKLDDSKGNVLLEKNQHIAINNVPTWFMNVLKLQAPIINTKIMANDKYFGNLYIQSNISFSYYKLYENMKYLFLILFFIFLFSIFVVYLGLKVIFSPLDKVQKQAKAILDNKFIIQEKMPFTTDLRRTVLAMNLMIQKVKVIFEREAKTLYKYQELLYKDTMSDLYNRRYFQTKFKEYIDSEEYNTGSVALLSFSDLLSLKKYLGFEKWRKFILSVGEILQQKIDAVIVSRLNENDFILLIPNLIPIDLKLLCIKILQDIRTKFEIFDIDEKECKVNMSLSSYSGETDLKNLLTKTDIGLAQARDKNNFELEIFNDNSSNIILGKSEYKNLIVDSMNKDKFKFAIQNVLNNDGSIEHCEVFLRLIDDKENWRKASYFMPMVHEINLSANLDLYVFNRLEYKYADFDCDFIAVNIGKEILKNYENLCKLEQILKNFHKYTKVKIFIEIPNKDDIDMQGVAILGEKLSAYGYSFGFDHFELNARSIDRLKEINPCYIKISAINLIDFFKDADCVAINALKTILESKNIKLIATGVESQKNKDELTRFGVTTMQGIYIDKIRNIG